jgi:glucokinase
MTIAEYLLGIAKGIPNFVLLWIGSGIGAGIMVDGRLLRGATSSAGEIGYNEVGFSISSKESYPLLYSGQKDFGDLLSEDSIVEAYIRASGRSRSDEITFGEILELGSKGDIIAASIFRELSRLVGIIGIMLVNTLNPELLVLGGSVIDSNPQVLNEVSRFLKRDILSTPVQSVRVEPAHYKADEVLLGAIGLILYELFEPQIPAVKLKQRLRKVRDIREFKQ